ELVPQRPALSWGGVRHGCEPPSAEGRGEQQPELPRLYRSKPVTIPGCSQNGAGLRTSAVLLFRPLPTLPYRLRTDSIVYTRNETTDAATHGRSPAHIDRHLLSTLAAGRRALARGPSTVLRPDPR